MSKVKWTTEQLQAIECKNNNILVAAAAGSGKTAVLVERIINKIINEKIDIDQILVVTFTNAAASEMRERILEAIYKKIEEEPQNVHLQKQINLIGRASICTIDSFCLEVVKNNFYEIDISPNFRIADSAELELIKQEALEELFNEKYENEDKEFLKLLDTYTTYSSDEPLRNIVLNIYNFIQSHPFPFEWLDEQIQKYNIENKLELDFSETEWGKIILNNIKESLENSKLKLEKLKAQLDMFDELKKYSIVIAQDIDNLNRILNYQKWDEIFNYISDMTFEKWPIDRKITLDEKEIAKEKRNEIKKEITKSLGIIDCNSLQANKDIYYMYPTLENIKKLVVQFSEILTKSKKDKNVVDFSDIEHLALNILLNKKDDSNYEPSDVAAKYRKKFTEIAIDEYQDSNLVQESILTSISNGNNMFMVGDVKQSIYKFRQARPELFLNKYDTYSLLEKKLAETIGVKIQLFKNFRSRKNILDTTNIIFEEIMSKELGDVEYNKEEYLNLGAQFDETEEKSIKENTQVFVIESCNKNKLDENTDEQNDEPIENIELEAKFVASKIKELINSKKLVSDRKVGYRPLMYKDIVILLRSTKNKANIFENELVNLNIPVYSDASMEYLNSIEIQTIINLLKIIDNPMVDIPLVAVLRSFIGGFPDNELMQMRLIAPKETIFYNSMEKYALTCKDELSKKITNFLNKLALWQEDAKYLELDELIWKLYFDTGYFNYVSLMPNGLLRQANLKLLLEKAKQYEKASFKGLYNFINFIDKVKTGSGDLSSAKLIGENENVVRIMSIHKSKGLEFPLVFLCNSNKKFNVQDLNNPILLHQDFGFGVNYIDSERKLQYPIFTKEAMKMKIKEEIISEEMRILYVALTRAKERLIITGVSKEIEKDLKQKEENLSLCESGKINKILLKKYNSYLDWIELAYLKNKETKLIDLQKIEKDKILENEVNNDNKEIDLNSILQNININDLNKLKEKLEWKYPYIQLSKIEGKTSVSKIKEMDNLVKSEMKMPEFIKQNEKKITGAQKGTLIHLCMQNLDINVDYDKEKVIKLVENLEGKKLINNVEAEKIDIDKILEFTKSHIWKELKDSKQIEREKAFYIMLPADEIYNNEIKDEILVQGVIDLYYINANDELVLVDYKTDYVQNEEELILKYNKQLELYKKALENALNKKVSKVYIYSTHLNKELLEKM